MRHNANMCGRYFLDTLPEQVAEQFSVRVPPDLAASFNIAPTQLAPIVLLDKAGNRALTHARWGLVPYWAKDLKLGSKMINARIETAATKPGFRAAWKRRRCLVPASGFYEWRQHGAHRQPFAIVPAGTGLLSLGGLWETWSDPQGERLRSFTIVTTEARGPIAQLHDRMPVMLSTSQQTGWLAGVVNTHDQVSSNAPTMTTRFYPVSREVNSPRNNERHLLDPLELSEPSE